MTWKVMFVMGTRPEAIKLAPVVLRAQMEAGFEPVVVTTGQHREMLDQVLQVFEIRPDIDLGIHRTHQTLVDVSTRALAALDEVLAMVAPDIVMVQGDTTTTFMGALAAFYRQVRVVHLEAGLRTGDNANPFPEEVNRKLTSVLAELHLAPTALAKENLLREGVLPARVVLTGNTVIDALLWTGSKYRAVKDPAVRVAASHPGPTVLVTAHRRESWGPKMLEVGEAIADVARAHPEVLVLLPLHRNPTVRESLLPPLEGLDNVLTTEPLDYISFVQAMGIASLVLTDSGGVQEEAPSLGKPVLVMRETTERPEGVQAGTARLVGTTRASVRDGVLLLLEDQEEYARMARRANPYGDGRATERVIAALRHTLGGSSPVDEWAG